MKKRNLIWLLLGALLLCGSTAWARSDRLPAYYPAAFDNIGVVDAISAKRDSMVVGDVFFHLSANTRVHGLRTQKVTLGWVERGSRIGFSTANDLITEIWILPSDYSYGSEE